MRSGLFLNHIGKNASARILFGWWKKRPYRYIYPLGALIFIIIVLHALHYPSHKHRIQNMIIEKVQQKKLQNLRPRPNEITLILVFCQDPSIKRRQKKTQTDLAKNWKRQLRQFKVMVKTAVLLSKRPLHFILITDTQKAFDKLTAITDGWPEQYTENVRMTRRKLYYPPGSESMKRMFRYCATQRLFLADMFPHLDAAIYLDTDFMFLRPLEDLWQQFRQFTSTNFAAMSPCLFHYGQKVNEVPYYGTTGLNAGLMMMNITRMRQHPRNLTQTFLKISEQYKHQIKLADQDILNIFFSKNPGLVMELGCDWNVRELFCQVDPYPCNKPISFIHGNALAYVRENSFKVRTVFETIEDWNLDHENTEDLPVKVWTALQQVEAKKLPDLCSAIKGYDSMILHYLYKNLAPHSKMPRNSPESGSELL